MTTEDLTAWTLRLVDLAMPEGKAPAASADGWKGAMDVLHHLSAALWRLRRASLAKTPDVAMSNVRAARILLAKALAVAAERVEPAAATFSDRDLGKLMAELRGDRALFGEGAMLRDAQWLVDTYGEDHVCLSQSGTRVVFKTPPQGRPLTVTVAESVREYRVRALADGKLEVTP